MNKRGMMSKQILWTFYLIINIMIGIFLMVYINNNASGKYFDNQFYAKDIGLTIETIYQSSGNLKINYNFENKVKFNLNENIIKICDAEDNKKCYSYELIRNPNYKIDNVELTTNETKLEKIGNEIKISEIKNE